MGPEQYISNALGTDITLEILPVSDRARLPLYLRETLKLQTCFLFGHQLVLAEYRDAAELSILQTVKQFEQLQQLLEAKIVLLVRELSALNRQRLIEKGINFIVPGKQLFLPELLMDLNEPISTLKLRPRHDKLIPTAQFVVLLHLLHRNRQDWKIEDLSLKALAEKAEYTPMAISKAVENLKYHEVIDITGTKEKRISFREQNNVHLWNDLEQRTLLASPVIKRVYVDAKPDVFMLHANTSALPEYTDMNPGRQEFFAIEKETYYELERAQKLVNPNEHEGRYCLEVWKYNPERLNEEAQPDGAVVDPLSLYLSLKGNPDERIDMALEQLVEQTIW